MVLSLLSLLWKMLNSSFTHSKQLLAMILPWGGPRECERYDMYVLSCQHKVTFADPVETSSPPEDLQYDRASNSSISLGSRRNVPSLSTAKKSLSQSINPRVLLSNISGENLHVRKPRPGQTTRAELPSILKQQPRLTPHESTTLPSSSRSRYTSSSAPSSSALSPSAAFASLSSLSPKPKSIVKRSVPSSSSPFPVPEDMARHPVPVRRSAVRETSNPYTTRRKANEAKAKTADRQTNPTSNPRTSVNSLEERYQVLCAEFLRRSPSGVVDLEQVNHDREFEERLHALGIVRGIPMYNPRQSSREREAEHNLTAQLEKAKENTVQNLALGIRFPPSATPSPPPPPPAFNGRRLSRLNGRGIHHDPIDLSSDSEDFGFDFSIPEHIHATSVHGANNRVSHATARLRECAVCGDRQNVADMPFLSQCTHQAETCAECFARWIASELTAKGWKGMTCPATDCKVILVHHEVQKYATAEVFAQYDAFAMRDTLGQMPNFRWCRNPSCNSGQIHDDGYIFTCVACSHKVCVIHEVDWHDGETCKQYTYRVSNANEKEQKAQEAASIKAIKKLSKKCPGPGCAFNIQKHQGCDHMTCSRCRHEFCWVCLADYSQIRRKGNAAHAANCNYHSSRIR